MQDALNEVVCSRSHQPVGKHAERPRPPPPGARPPPGGAPPRPGCRSAPPQLEAGCVGLDVELGERELHGERAAQQVQLLVEQRGVEELRDDDIVQGVLDGTLGHVFDRASQQVLEEPREVVDIDLEAVQVHGGLVEPHCEATLCGGAHHHACA